MKNLTLNRDVVEHYPGEAINALLGSAVYKGQGVYVSTTDRTVARSVANAGIIGVALEDKSSGSYCRIFLNKPIVYIQKSNGWSDPAAGDLCGQGEDSDSGEGIGCVTYFGAALNSTGATYDIYGRAFGFVWDDAAIDTSYLAVVMI